MTRPDTSVPGRRLGIGFRHAAQVMPIGVLFPGLGGTCRARPSSRLVVTAWFSTTRGSSSCGRRTYVGIEPPPITLCTPGSTSSSRPGAATCRPLRSAQLRWS